MVAPPTIPRSWSPEGDRVVAQDVSPGLTLSARRVRQDGTGITLTFFRAVGIVFSRGVVPEGTRVIYNAYPALTCWATIVAPFGLSVDDSHPFPKGAKGWGRVCLPYGT